MHDPTGDLTQAFVEDLNWLTATQVLSQGKRTKRGLRVILFFDGFEPSATEAATWLLDPFLQTTLSKNVVLVVAGRDPIERSISNEQTMKSVRSNLSPDMKPAHTSLREGLPKQTALLRSGSFRAACRSL